MTKRSIGITLLLALLLPLAGCGNSPITYLNLAVEALEVAVPLIGPAAGIPPGVVTQVGIYLGGVSQAISQASDILAGPGTDAEKTAQIVAAFAGIAAPIVPAQYQALVSAIQTVAADIAKFIASLPAVPASSSVSTPVSDANRVKLHQIKTRALTVKLAVRR